MLFLEYPPIAIGGNKQINYGIWVFSMYGREVTPLQQTPRVLAAGWVPP
jgi:hypothetical protein